MIDTLEAQRSRAEQLTVAEIIRRELLLPCEVPAMLGRTLQREFPDWELCIADLPECDITDAAGFDRFLAATRPDAVIHCAAMTAVDRCETEPELAYRLNVIGTANVASACFRHRVRLVAISTDYVFRGDLDRPYHEFDRPDPLTVYGITKFAGEEMVRTLCPDHLVCRISWLYGAGGPSFVHTMMQLADGTRPELKVVVDQIGNPTSTTAVARKLRELLQRPELAGTYHLTCEGEASWHAEIRARQSAVHFLSEPGESGDVPSARNAE